MVLKIAPYILQDLVSCFRKSYWSSPRMLRKMAVGKQTTACSSGDCGSPSEACEPRCVIFRRAWPHLPSASTSNVCSLVLSLINCLTRISRANQSPCKLEELHSPAVKHQPRGAVKPRPVLFWTKHNWAYLFISILKVLLENQTHPLLLGVGLLGAVK